jgi:AsmA protein
MIRPASAAPVRSSPFGAIALDGRVRIDHLTWRGLTFGGFDGHLSGQEAQFLLREQVARFYSGSLSGEVELDTRPAVPLISLRQKAVGMSFGDLLRALQGEESPLSGLGDLEAEVTTRGLTKAELLASLSGRAGLRMPEGEFQGFDLEALVQGIEAQIRGKAPPGKPQGGGRTRFSRLGATARIEQGILNTEDLRVESGHFRVNGKGRIDLSREVLDLALLARVEQAPAGSSLKQVEGINIPLRVTGGLQSPEIQIDPGPVVEELAKRRIQRELGGPEVDALKQLEQRTRIPGLEQGLKSLLGR